ncbi:MAG: STAS domain-containing protein [Chloroflexota bacterium]
MAAPEEPPSTIEPSVEPPSSADPASTVLAVGGSIAPVDPPTLADRARLLIAAAPGQRVVCDVTSSELIDLATIDLIARLALAAKQLGCEFSVRAAPGAVPELLALIGLAEVIACDDASVVEPRRQAEEREEPLRVEEEHDPRDSIA